MLEELLKDMAENMDKFKEGKSRKDLIELVDKAYVTSIGIAGAKVFGEDFSKMNDEEQDEHADKIASLATIGLMFFKLLVTNI